MGPPKRAEILNLLEFERAKVGESLMFLETLELNFKWVLFIWVDLKHENESFGKI